MRNVLAATIATVGTAIAGIDDARAQPICYRVGVDTAQWGQRLILSVKQDGNLVKKDKNSEFPSAQTAYRVSGTYIVYNVNDLSDAPMLSSVNGSIDVAPSGTIQNPPGAHLGLTIDQIKFLGCESTAGGTACYYQVPMVMDCFTSAASSVPTSWNCARFVTTVSTSPAPVAINIAVTQLTNDPACRIFSNFESPTPTSSAAAAALSAERGWLRKNNEGLPPGIVTLPGPPANQ